MNTGVNEQLKDLKIEDIIWITYFFLAIFSLISNQFERNSLIQNNRRFNRTSQKINITIFITTFIIYLYFAFINWRDVERLKQSAATNGNNNILTSQARLIAALLFLVGGAIYLVTEAQGQDNSEIGFI